VAGFDRVIYLTAFGGIDFDASPISYAMRKHGQLRIASAIQITSSTLTAEAKVPAEAGISEGGKRD